MRSVAQHRKDGSKSLTLKQLVGIFYTSRFNRDNFHDPAPGEDINHSIKYRMYNKSDVLELMRIFVDFLEDAFISENISKIMLSKELVLRRETRMPRIKRANQCDITNRKSDDGLKVGELYVTRGKYIWYLDFDGELLEKSRKIRDADPEIIKKKKELLKEIDERNKLDNAES